MMPVKETLCIYLHIEVRKFLFEFLDSFFKRQFLQSLVADGLEGITQSLSVSKEATFLRNVAIRSREVSIDNPALCVVSAYRINERRDTINIIYFLVVEGL